MPRTTKMFEKAFVARTWYWYKGWYCLKSYQQVVGSLIPAACLYTRSTLISTLRLELAIEWSLLICRTSMTMALQTPQVLWGCVTNRELCWGASGAIHKKPYGVHIVYEWTQTFKVLKLPLVWRKTTNFEVDLFVVVGGSGQSRTHEPNSSIQLSAHGWENSDLSSSLHTSVKLHIMFQISILTPPVARLWRN